jgi:hypothetical protein
MSQERVQDLGNARSTLVKARRDWANSIASGSQRGKAEDAIKAIAEIQLAIDVIDRTTLDEGRLIAEGK